MPTIAIPGHIEWVAPPPGYDMPPGTIPASVRAWQNMDQAAWLSTELDKRRRARMALVFQILNKVWDTYMRKAYAQDERIYAAMAPRLTVTDLLTPVLTTIGSAVYAGRIQRRITRAYDPAGVERFMAMADWAGHRKTLNLQSLGYGTGYGKIGRSAKGRPRLTTILPPTAWIETADDDSHDITGVVEVLQGGDERAYDASGPLGFMPIAIERPRRVDPTTPYGDMMFWPAVTGTVDATFFANDVKHLERTQSYSILVVKGNSLSDPKDGAMSPYTKIRLDPNDGNADAKFISPNGEISAVSELIDDTFRRTAVQCQVPVEVFTEAKAGTGGKTGASMLKHRPMYDLVSDLQEAARLAEIEEMAMIDAFLLFEKYGQPVDLDDVRDHFRAEVKFAREVKPQRTQEEIQNSVMLLDNRLSTHEREYRYLNDDPTAEEIAEQGKLWEQDHSVGLGGGDPAGDFQRAPDTAPPETKAAA